MALDVRPRSLGITYPHHRITRENQRHITGKIWEALTILQTGNRTGKPGSQPTEVNAPAGPRCDQKVNEVELYSVENGLSKRGQLNRMIGKRIGQPKLGHVKWTVIRFVTSASRCLFDPVGGI